MPQEAPAPATAPRRYAEESRLLRGSGPGPGPLAQAFPYEQRTMLHVLRHRAEHSADQEWLVFDGADRLTFGQAEEQVRRFASAVVTAGFRKPRVALLLRNQPEFIPAFFGAQLADGFAAPLNPESRGPMLSRLLIRCEAQILVVRSDLLPVLCSAPSLGQVALVLVCGDTNTSSEIHGVPVRGFRSWYAHHSPLPFEHLPEPGDLAALVFTSGTSGGSKAAMWTHHYQYFSSASVSDALGHTPGDVLSTPLQMCHIAGLQNFANSALHVGCTAHLKSAFSASRWWDEIAADGATFAMLMGPMAGMVLDRVPQAPRHRLRTVYILPQPARRAEFEQRYGTTVVWQGWGMTEIFPHVPSATRLEDVPADTIGPPPSWTDFGVVDENDRMLAPGELGEMVYRPLIPCAMASGYYGDPVATNKAFRNFMFHTGDLGYYDETGRIHFVMRNQDAIRRRGENVSAVELEQVVRQHPAIADAAAYAVPADLGEHEVKLDLIARPDAPLNLDEFFGWLTNQLPRFMLPRYLEQRTEFPRTPSQRVQKYLLAEEKLDRPQVREFLPPARRTR
ncbi:ATP-dependent acyl-CoA ligase [Amycolatopsis ultiminotia]|uniref:ATP-dependent acyl-CoA ligase n=1 Tax=Amycolatopsis ultiminotia TaxID=543629 RepID=A0ABP6UUZ6_9PSEU